MKSQVKSPLVLIFISVTPFQYVHLLKVTALFGLYAHLFSSSTLLFLYIEVGGRIIHTSAHVLSLCIVRGFDLLVKHPRPAESWVVEWR